LVLACFSHFFSHFSTSFN